MKTANQIINRLSYQEQLKDPRWKSYAAAIKEQRNFCENCRRRDVRVEVHHLFYEWDRMLWEYEQEEVVVLCSSCHSEIHEELKKFRKYVFRYLTPKLFKILNGCLAVGLTKYQPLVYLHALAEFTGNEPLVTNHARAYGLETARNNK
jgi:hypothetical protein